MIICTVSEKNVLPEKFVTVVLSNFRKTRTKDRIVSNRIFFKKTEKETANQTFTVLNLFQIKYYKIRFIYCYSSIRSRRIEFVCYT
jgi:hypothetical protein